MYQSKKVFSSSCPLSTLTWGLIGAYSDSRERDLSKLLYTQIMLYPDSHFNRVTHWGTRYVTLISQASQGYDNNTIAKSWNWSSVNEPPKREKFCHSVRLHTINIPKPVTEIRLCTVPYGAFRWGLFPTYILLDRVYVLGLIEDLGRLHVTECTFLGSRRLMIKLQPSLKVACSNLKSY